MDDLQAIQARAAWLRQQIEHHNHRYYTLDEFAELKRFAQEELKFAWVECAPLVRSSYHADEQVRALSVVHRKLYGEQDG